ncbi:hypothetical protein TUE45_pSRTUE45c_0059 (plasmid) [Streptomyces reticuli]|nr:hypothetical protein TUE45_pSRTUE45c_0059 [Streptomyces reticuli]
MPSGSPRAAGACAPCRDRHTGPGAPVARPTAGSRRPPGTSGRRGAARRRAPGPAGAGGPRERAVSIARGSRNAESTAVPLPSPSSTPTTTIPKRAPRCSAVPRTTTTGPSARAATARLTEPSGMPARSPCPLGHSTSAKALRPLPTSAEAVSPGETALDNRTAGACSAARADAARMTTDASCSPVAWAACSGAPCRAAPARGPGDRLRTRLGSVDAHHRGDGHRARLLSGRDPPRTPGPRRGPHAPRRRPGDPRGGETSRVPVRAKSGPSTRSDSFTAPPVSYATEAAAMPRVATAVRTARPGTWPVPCRRGPS